MSQSVVRKKEKNSIMPQVHQAIKKYEDRTIIQLITNLHNPITISEFSSTLSNKIKQNTQNQPVCVDLQIFFNYFEPEEEIEGYIDKIQGFRIYHEFLKKDTKTHKELMFILLNIRDSIYENYSTNIQNQILLLGEHGSSNTLLHVYNKLINSSINTKMGIRIKQMPFDQVYLSIPIKDKYTVESIFLI